jgi:hypothetical protein
MDEYESLSHASGSANIMSCSFPSAAGRPLRGAETTSWRGVSQAGAAKGKPDRRRSPDAGPRSHDDFDSAEVRGLAGGRFIKGKSAIHLAGVYGRRSEMLWGSISGQEGTSSRP